MPRARDPSPRPNRSPSEPPAEHRPARRAPAERPVLRLFATTLWEFPSQHYDRFVDDDGTVRSSRHAPAGHLAMQGDKDYAGATPSWVIWQCLRRYTRPGDVIVDPMCGSGTTIDVCADLHRTPACFDLAPSRPDIRRADARAIPLPDASADFVFIDPPYSTHITYSDDPACIGRLSAGGEDNGRAYYAAMDRVIAEIHRVLRPKRCMALYVSDSFRKKKGQPGGEFMPIGPELFRRLAQRFRPLDIICVARGNRKLDRANWRRAAEEGNFFLRGFNYLFLMRKDS
jgi:DNA modification methylase